MKIGYLLGIMLLLIVFIGSQWKDRWAYFKKKKSERARWEAFNGLLHLLRLETKLGKYYGIILRDMTVLYGSNHALQEVRNFLCKQLGLVFVLQLLLCICGYALADASVLLVIVLFSVAVPIVGFKEIQQQLKRRRRSILIELPKLLNKIALLMSAGETLQRSMIKAAEGRSDDHTHPLYKEWNRLIQQLKNQYPFQQAMEEFNRRCAVREVTLLTNTILLHFRQGGEEFVTAMRSLSQQLWEARKATAKTLGEEASSKLVFPMVLIFFVVLMMTAAPAILSIDF